MGFRTSSARRLSAQSAVASSIVVLPDTTGTGPTLSGSGINANTTLNKQITTIGQTTAEQTTVLSGVTVTNVYVTDSSFNLIDDTALDPAGGYLKIIGNGFKTGCAVYINGSSVTTTFISSTELRVTTSATTAGTYNLMVFNTDGNGAIYLNLSVSNFPAYTTSAGSLGTVYETNPYTQSIIATGDAPLTYSLYSGTLPPNATLAANGVISGTSPVENSSNTYSFVVNVKDAQNQETTRSFSLTINTDVVTWSSPANNTIYSLVGDTPISNITLSAASAGNKTITYTANSLPTGLTLSGNTIYGTPNTSQTVYTEFTATAATSNRSAKRYVSWSITLSDPYFSFINLMLSASSTVSSFIDDASTNKLITTVSGDTRADNFSPYTTGYYSHYFNGSTYYYLNNQLAFGSGDFTLEMWCFFSDVTNAQNIFEGRPNGSNGAYPTIYILSGTIRYFTASGDRITSSPVVTNKWYHIAVVRSSGTTKMYINGTQDGVSYTDSATYLTGASRPLIASYNGSSGNFTGYISNLRVVLGTAVYTTTFTPSTTPLTVVANTQLMVCGTNRILDLSTNAYTLTTAGTVKVTPAHPFTANSSYATYGSGYFDGTGDYLTLSPTMNIGTNDFTAEAWVYRTATPSYQTVFSLNSYPNGILFRWETTVFGIYVGSTGYSIALPNSNGMPINEWSHVALVRQSGVFKVYINGTQVYSFTTTYSINITSIMIGRSIHNSTELWNGYIADARIVANTAVYTANTAPPSTPLTAIANTALLTLQTNKPHNSSTFKDESIFDNAMTKTGTSSQGAMSPYGDNWSYAFDGSGDYLSVTSSSGQLDATGDFTMELWIYWHSMPTTGYQNICGNGNIAGTYGLMAGNAAQNSWTAPYVLKLNQASVGDYINGNTTLVAGQWYHIAHTRTSGVNRLFVNGVLQTNTATETTSRPYGTNGAFLIGNNSNCMISNLRYIKGTSLYTATFTPPTAPLTAVANTQLLVCNTNKYEDVSPNKLAVARNGDAYPTKVSPFKQVLVPKYYSSYFNSASYETASITGGLGSGDFTIEGWVYLTAAYGNNGFFHITPGGYLPSNGTGIAFATYNNKWHAFFNGTGDPAGIGNTPVLNRWYHFAFVKSSNTIKIYIDGVQINSASDTTDYTSTTYLALGGYYSTGYLYAGGYISNFRIVRGTALYSGSDTVNPNFTPSTTPLTAVANTVFLGCQNNTNTDSSSNAFPITVSGDVKPYPVSPFTPSVGGTSQYTPADYGGSIYFPDTSSYLKPPSGSWQVFGTGDFTVECWVYATAASHNFSLASTTTNAWGLITYLNTVYWQFNGANVQSSSISLPVFCWSHVAVSRVNGVTKGFINGTQVFSAADTNNYSSTTADRGIGPNGGSGGVYISDFRVIPGKGLYSSNFYPGPTPLTPIVYSNNSTTLANTSYATMHVSGATSGILDSSRTFYLQSVGDVKVTTAKTPYATGQSYYFDGSGDYLSLPSSPALALPGDFTVEAWVNIASFASERCIVDLRGATGTVGLVASITSTNGYPFIYKEGVGFVVTSSIAVTLNAWTHVAYVRSGTTTTIYVNGVSGGSATDSTSWSAPNGTGRIGANKDAGTPVLGYISDLRITKNYARYTTTFTPPAGSFIAR